MEVNVLKARIANKTEDINLNHLMKYWEHDDVPYYDLEALLECEEEDTHTLYVRHFFTQAKNLTSSDFPPNWGTLHMFPAVLQLIHLRVDGVDFYPFKQEHYKVHITGATMGANSHGELRRLAWHLNYHQADVLSLPPINTIFTLKNGTASMERQTRPLAMPIIRTTKGKAAGQIASLSERHSNSLEAVSKHTLATIQSQLQAAMQTSKEVMAAQVLNKELQEANALAQAAVEAHPIFFGLHDDYQDLDLAI
eukprot:s374_g31.t1